MGDNATTIARHAEQSEALDHAVRLGLVAYGVLHLIIAGTALDMALTGGSSGSASQTGALAELAGTPFGEVLLYVVAGGFAALVLWQGLEALIGHRRADGTERLAKRVASGTKAVVYAVLSFSAARIAVSGGSSGGGSGKKGKQDQGTTDSLTAQLMSAPAGQVLVGLVGIGVVAVGCYLIHRGWTEKFTKQLDGRATAGERRTPIVLLGKVGYCAKGVALAAVGSLFLVAAAQHEPKEAGGLDVALHEMLRQPFGPFLLGGVALGLGCFGLFSLAWARHLNR